MISTFQLGQIGLSRPAATGGGSSQDTVNDYGLPSLANIDSFNGSSSLSNYTVTQDGAVGSMFWQISGGACALENGFSKQSVCRRNSFSAANCSVQAIVTSGTDSGIVARFQDQNNFYLFLFLDDSSAVDPNNLKLFKRVGGTFTQLGSSVNVTWARGTQKTFRLTCSGSTITCYMDGVSQISVTDTAISAAGAIGMRGNSGGLIDSFNTLTWG